MYFKGWIPDTPDARDWTVRIPQVRPLLQSPGFRAAQSEYPRRVEWTQFRPPIRDQGQLGSCTGWACNRVIEFHLLKQTGKFIPMSPLFTYWNTRDDAGLLPQGDTGASIRDTIKCLAEYGACPEKAWPYNIKKYQVQPPIKAYIRALNFQATNYIRLNSLTQIKAFLRAGFPVVFGFYCFESLNYVGRDGWIPYPKPGEKMEGGHAIVADGYDDDKAPPPGVKDEPGALIVANSWGTGWGNNGIGYLPYKYFDPRNPLAMDAWVILTMEIPSLVKVFGGS